MSIIDKLREAKIQGRLEESMFYEIVANEMEKGEYFKGLQTQAFAEAEGDERKAKALYIKLRVKALKDEIYIHEKEPKKKATQNQSQNTSQELKKKPVEIKPVEIKPGDDKIFDGDFGCAILLLVALVLAMFIAGMVMRSFL